MRALLLSVILAFVGASSLAITPESSRAVILAAQSGEVIGAASVCGMPERELVEVGRQVIGQIRDLATSDGELARARRAHEEAVSCGAERATRAGEKACPEALERVRALTRAR